MKDDVTSDRWTYLPRLTPTFSDDVDAPGRPTLTRVRLIAELATAHDTIQRLQKENDRLRTRLKTALRALSDESVGTTTLTQASHIATAERYRDLVAQDLQHLARVQLSESHVELSPSRLATQIRNLCRDLFIERISNASNLCQRNGLDPNEHATAAREVIRKATEIANQYPGAQWRLDVVSGRRLNPSDQEPWSQCDPDAEIEFAVAPAYVVDGRVYAKQSVFTTQKKPFWRRS